LKRVMDLVVYHGHPWFRKGTLTAGNNTSIHFYQPGCARIELTGDVVIGNDSMVGAYTRIYTHDHFHKGRDKTMFQMMKENGVKWNKLVIGNDVWIHDGATILSQVTLIPDGCVIGANATLTKNPGPYEIWAGVPAHKVGVR